MPQDPFKSASENVGITQYEGNLLLVTPLEKIEEMATSFGEASPVKADFVVLDGDDGFEEVSDALIFPRALIAKLESQAKYNEANPDGDPKTGHPRMTLGRLGKGEAKKGQSAPWILLPPSDEDAQLARDYLAGKAAEPENPFEKV